jgi:4-amino-4-deoxy-L-arabinose transferase-like glycosyltransferase
MDFIQLQKKINWNYAFIAFLILFIFCKIPFLNMAFFWDECWSYAPALRKMSETTISLLPGAIDTFNYRGHPLLFYALGGAWLKLFGTSYIAFHSYGLVYGVGLLFIVFLLIKKIANASLAFFAVLIIATQGFFIIQSSTVLPEIAVAFWVVLSYFFYLHQKWLGYFIACSCLLLTKESGIVILPSILFAYSIYNFIDKTDSLKTWFINCVKICLPAIPLILFFVLQYQKMGWAFFPEHVGFIDYRSAVIFAKLSSFCNYLFLDDMHKLFTVIILSVFLFSIVKNKFSFYKSIPIIQKKTLAYLFCFILFYLLFSAINFFTLRYLICVLVLVLLIFILLLHSLLPRFSNIILVCIAIIVFIKFTTNRELGENKLGMYDSIEVCEQGVKWAEQNIVNTNASIRVDDFILKTQLCDNGAGFRTNALVANNIISYTDSNNNYFIISSMGDGEKRKHWQKNSKMKLIQKFDKNQAWYEVWQIGQ